jgi:Tfp pilus assembly protein PilE
MQHQNRSGQKFNKVELVIAALVMTVLASVALPIYFVSVNRSRLSSADKSLSEIRLSLRQYQAQHGSYPLERKFVPVTSLPIKLEPQKIVGESFVLTEFTYTSWDGRSYVIRLTGEGENKAIRRQVTNTGIYSSF